MDGEVTVLLNYFMDNTAAYKEPGNRRHSVDNSRLKY